MAFSITIDKAFLSDFDIVPDLSRTLIELQQRVNSLERSLMPFTTPSYQAMTAYNNFIPSSYQANGNAF